MTKKYKKPDWYDEDKLRKVYYAEGYRGWVIDLGDGTCRFANSPLLGENGPKWGDRVKLLPDTGEELQRIDATKIIERYDSSVDEVDQ